MVLHPDGIRLICSCDVGYVDPKQGNAIPTEERTANAKLIGSAPDLLEALKQLLEDSEKILGELGCPAKPKTPDLLTVAGFSAAMTLAQFTLAEATS